MESEPLSADLPPAPRATVDWVAVRERLARQSAAMDETFAGRGPWADGIRRRRAEEMAERPDSLDAERPTIPLLLARGESTLYGLDLRHLAHIVPLPRVARVPGAAPAMLGVIAVGGKVMRLFDLDRLCGAAALPLPPEGGAGGYAVILRTGAGRPAALRVAAVERAADIDPPRAGAPPEAGPLIRAVTGDRMAILDMGALLDFVKT